MKIGVIGHNYTHGADFVMDYPDGAGCYLFLFGENTCTIAIEREKVASGKEYNSVFYAPRYLPL